MAKKKKEDVSELIAYINKLAPRVTELENISRETKSSIINRDKYLKHMKSGIDADLGNLNKGIESVMYSVNRQKDIIKMLVNDFKGIAKQDRFERVKEKLDAWNPQGLVTRNEVKKKISS